MQVFYSLTYNNCSLRLVVGIIVVCFFYSSCTGDVQPEMSIPEELISTDVFTGDFPRIEDNTTSCYLNPDHPAIINMRKRANLIGRVQWVPLNPIPTRSGFFSPGSKYEGIPYSSVKELDKFIGQEVSFYTFLTAIHNPRSVLYTERVCDSPYHGDNCAAYYGTVCSMTVNYILGLKRPYSTWMYGSLNSMQRVSVQGINSAQPGDIIWTSHHVLLITDVTRNSLGDVTGIEIVESMGVGTSFKKYPLTNFENRFGSVDWILYRYKNLDKLVDDSLCQVSEDDLFLEDLAFNNDLCLNRGDKVTYREGEIVVLNILSSAYSTVELYKDGVLISNTPYEGSPDITYSGLAPGSYSALLCNVDGKKSSEVHFEVIQTNVSVSRVGNIINLAFNSINSTPEYVVFCDISGSGYYISDISETERQAGRKYVRSEASVNDRYVKVFFRGKFGRVSNSIIPL